MQSLLVVLLIGVLVAAVSSFAVIGCRQMRRTAALARKVHETGMRFSRDDPFGVPCRYARFAVIHSGHSPHAENVTAGRIEGWPLRAFDFRYEVGHGTRRTTRHYGVVVVETDLPVGEVLMWHEKDRQSAPLIVSRSRGRVGPWSCLGDRPLAEALAGACGRLAETGGGFQTAGGTLMIFEPARRRGGDYTDSFACAAAAVRRLRAVADARASNGRDFVAAER